MIFDRISLLNSYGVLKLANNSEGRVGQILFNRTSFYGTKTNMRFGSLIELANYIQENHAFQIFDPACVCGTCDESIWKLLSFSVELPNRRYVTYINNLRGAFESGDGTIMNKKTVDAVSADFVQDRRLGTIKENFECHGYIQNQGRYVTPCEYVDMITNSYYDELIKKYVASKNMHGLSRAEMFVDKCHEGEIVKKKVWATTTLATTTVLPTTTIQTFKAATTFLNQAMATSVVGDGFQETTNILANGVATHSVALRKNLSNFQDIKQLTYSLSGNDGTGLTGVVNIDPDGSTLSFANIDINIFIINGEIVLGVTHNITQSDSILSFSIRTNNSYVGNNVSLS
jgi:hypothetical protein|tara:strand:+ start:1596 stop:2627 length:1032 start_codon:yes stop_codon:yes gene_type:complete